MTRAGDAFIDEQPLGDPVVAFAHLAGLACAVASAVAVVVLALVRADNALLLIAWVPLAVAVALEERVAKAIGDELGLRWPNRQRVYAYLMSRRSMSVASASVAQRETSLARLALELARRWPRTLLWSVALFGFSAVITFLP